MLDTATTVMSHPLMMLIYGILLNLVAILMDESAKAGTTVHPWEYLKSKPYRTALSFLAAIAGYGALSSQGGVDAITALVLGYAGADVLNRMVATTANKLAKGG